MYMLTKNCYTFSYLWAKIWSLETCLSSILTPKVIKRLVLIPSNCPIDPFFNIWKLPQSAARVIHYCYSSVGGHCVALDTMTPFNRLLRVWESLFLYLSVPNLIHIVVFRLPDSWSNRNFEVFVFEEKGKVPREKSLGAKEENQQPTQTTYGVDAGIWTLTTWVGGKCSHQCATLAI